MSELDLVTCNLIIEATGRVIGIYDLPRKMDKLAWHVDGEQHVVGEIHMHTEHYATVFLVPGTVEIENRPVPAGNLAYVDIYAVEP